MYTFRGVTDLNDEDYSAVFTEWQITSTNTLNEWSAALGRFLQHQGDTLSEDEKKSVGILQIHKCLGFIPLFLQKREMEDQVLWDDFLPSFSTVVQLAEQILQIDTQPMPRQPSPFFSLDMLVIGPLYVLVSKCRDPVVRRKAISLLNGASRQEGVWNSFLTAKVAERIVQIEEEGLSEVTCCADIPEWARISEVVPIFDPARRRVTIQYSRSGDVNHSRRQKVEDVIEW